MSYQKILSSEIIIALGLGSITGILLFKYPIGYPLLVIAIIVLGYMYNKGILIKDRALFICLFWVIYSMVSTLLYKHSITKGAFYPLYLFMIINGAFSVFYGNKIYRQQLCRISMVWYIFISLIIIGFMGIDYIYQDDIKKRLFIYMLTFITFLQLPSYNSNKLLILTQKSISIILIVWLIIYNITISGFSYRGGVGINQNYLSTILAVGLLGVLFSILSKDEVNKNLFNLYVLNVIPFFAGIYCLLILGSRGVSAAFFISSLLLLLMRKNNIHIKKHILALMFFVPFIIKFLPGSSNLFIRISDQQVTTLNGRIPIWINSIEQYANGNIFQLLFGRGVGSSRMITNSFNPMLESTHNGYIQFLIEFGVFGLIILLAIFFLSFYSNYINENKLSSFGIALTVFLLLINMSSSQDNFIFWICLGQALAIGGIEHEAKG